MVGPGPCRRDIWRAEVLRSAAIGEACRVLLLVLANSMTEGGYTSVSQEQLVDILGVHKRRISERVAQAKTAGYLIQRGGYRGRTSEYVAVLPERKGDAKPHPIEQPQTRTLSVVRTGSNRARKGAGLRHPNTRASTDVTTTQRQEHTA